MGLDYTDGCVNFRDVGTFVNMIADKKQMPENKILRGGSIDYIKSLEEIQTPKTIVNLRNGHDSISNFDGEYLHFPMSNKIEKYDTAQKEVKKWLNSIMRIFENPELQYPVFIHCLSGKDRTGIVIASLLTILEIDKETIIEEYFLSDGDLKQEWIQLALSGIHSPSFTKYFERLDIKQIQKNIQI